MLDQLCSTEPSTSSILPATMIERLFHLSENGTTARTEVVAGVTTFLAMAYIIFVQPAVLARAGMDPGAVLTATCLASALATLLMGLLANYPALILVGVMMMEGVRHVRWDDLTEAIPAFLAIVVMPLDCIRDSQARDRPQSRCLGGRVCFPQKSTTRGQVST